MLAFVAGGGQFAQLGSNFLHFPNFLRFLRFPGP